MVINRHSRMTAIFLAAVLGGLGIHKFYLGQFLSGFVYQIGLVISYLWLPWLFLISTIIAFVEMIIYLTMSDEQFAEKYNRSK